MKFFVYSQSGDASGIAIRLKQEGNDVCLYTKDAVAKNVARGLVDRVGSPLAGLATRPDCVIFDMVGLGPEADRMRKQGLNVIGGGVLNDRLEFDRSFAMDLCEKLGIKMPPFHEFKVSQLDAAIDFVAESKKRYVLKTDDNSGGTSLTYVAATPDDMIGYLEWAQKRSALKVDFMLQEFIQGIELSTEVWFSHGVPVYPSNSTVESKKFMVGDVGPNTGCMASVVWGYGAKEPRIVQQTLKKMYPPLKAIRYTGPLDCNCIVSEQDGKAYFLEFTPRLGYSAIYALAELMEEPLGKVLHGIASGKLVEMKLKEEFGMCVRLSTPPYPLHPSVAHKQVFMETAGRRVRKLPDKHSWLLDVCIEDGELVTGGVDGVICEVSYSGKNLQAVSDKIYEMIKHVELPDKQYRVDGAERTIATLPRLRSLNYESPDPLNYSNKSMSSQSDGGQNARSSNIPRLDRLQRPDNVAAG